MSLSRRKFIVTSAMGVVGGAIARPSWLRAWQQPQAPAPQTPAPIMPVFTPIRGNVGWFTGRGGTIGYYIGKTGVVVVDTQSIAAAQLLIEGLNQRSGNKPFDLVINTHHHSDHTGGNPAFKGIVTHILTQEKSLELHKSVSAAQAEAAKARGVAPAEQLFADETFGASWSGRFDDETIRADFYGPAHTGGDAIIHFEKANVVHMGDLVFNRRQPVTDRPGGCQIKTWSEKLDKALKKYPKDAVYIYGHAGTQFPVSGPIADLTIMRGFLSALLDFTKRQMKVGKTKDEIIAIKDVLPGFPDHGPLAASVLTAAYEELSR